jgi:flagellar biosynthetic protein FliP
MRVPALALAVLAATAGAAAAQSVSIDLGAAGGAGQHLAPGAAHALIGLLALAPSLLVMATAFARIVMVLSCCARPSARRASLPTRCSWAWRCS